MSASLLKLSTLLSFGLGLNWVDYGVDSNILQLTVSNIKSIEGNIMVAVYDDPQKFTGDVVVKGKIERVTKTGEMTIEIADLSFGEYAISVFHDQNNNNILDSNMFKMPTEPYGFSNNARGRFGPPGFDDARINFNATQKTFSIRLK